MSWPLRFASGVSRDLRHLDPSDARFILDSLEAFVSNFDRA